MKKTNKNNNNNKGTGLKICLKNINHIRRTNSLKMKCQIINLISPTIMNNKIYLIQLLSLKLDLINLKNLLLKENKKNK